jgi:hypothetical protein
MKNSSVKDDLSGASKEEKSPLKKVEETNNLNPKAVKPTMTEQLIAPPSYIWDKIEQVLDQQQVRRDEGSEIISASFSKPHGSRKKYYAIAGITVLAGFLWLMF